MIFLLLGLVTAISTVVALVSMTSAMKQNIEKTMDEFGANIIITPKSDDLSISYGGITISGVSYDVRELNESSIAKLKTIKNKESISVLSPKLLATSVVKGRKVLLVGINFENELLLKRWWSINGEKPHNTNDILVGFEASKKLNVKKGEKLKIENQFFRVSGILGETGGQEDALIFVNLKKLQTIFNKLGKLSMIEIAALCNTCPIEHMVMQMADVLPDAKVSAVKQSVKAKEETAGQLQKFSLAVSFIVVMIASLIVLVTMMSSVQERIKEIGVFRAIGFRKFHVAKIILAESSLVSFAGGVLGYGVGMGLAVLLLPLIAQMKISVELDIKMLLSAVVLSFLVGAISSIYPAMKAAKLDVVEALRAI